MLVKMLNILLFCVFSLQGNATDHESRSIEDFSKPKTLISLQTYKIYNENKEVTQLSINKPLISENIDLFKEELSSLSAVERTKITALKLENISDPKIAKIFFNELKSSGVEIYKFSLSRPTCSTVWKDIGKGLSKLPNILHLDLSNTSIQNKDLQKFLSSYSNSLIQAETSSKIRGISFHNCDKLEESELPAILSKVINDTMSFPDLCALQLQNTCMERYGLDYQKIKDLTVTSHSQSMNNFCSFYLKSEGIKGESLLLPGAFIFTPYSERNKIFETSAKMDDKYSAWLSGIPRDFDLSSLN